MTQLFNNARIVLADRVIERGARADLVRVHHGGPLPLVREVWRTGRRVH